ncbi:MAG TPA: hypothetical protein VFB31_05425 [Pseudolabrys sp.]|nr:hypothetical protein [Pseudolabrys sp.]
MTKSKTIAAALAAITLATALTAGTAQARPRFGTGLAIGLGAGALIGAAAATSYQPVYVYRACHYEPRWDSWGNRYLVKVCVY